MRPLQAIYMSSYATCLFMNTVYSVGTGSPLVTVACEWRHQHAPCWPSVALITARRPRPCVAPLPAAGALWPGVQTLMCVPTGVGRLAALALIVSSAAFHRLGSGAHWTLDMALCVVVTTKPRAAGVTRARLCRTILLETKRAPGDGSGVTSERLVVESEVWY